MDYMMTKPFSHDDYDEFGVRHSTTFNTDFSMPKIYTFNEIEVSDLHKDAYGFRPSESFWTEWQLANNDEKQFIWDEMIAAFENDIFIGE
jgi:hypothetical protein